MVTVCIQNCFGNVLTMLPFHKSCSKCYDRNSSLLQIRSHISKYFCDQAQKRLFE